MEQRELTISLGGPVVVLLLVAVPWFVYSAHVRRDLERRTARLIQWSAVERRVLAAEALTAGGRLQNGGSERAAALGVRVNEGGAELGLVIRSANVEKVLPAGQDWFAEFKVSVKGEGPLEAWIRCLEAWERSDLHLRVAAGRWRVATLVPKPRYEGELTLLSRALRQIHGGARAKPATDGLTTSCARLDALLSGLRADHSRSWPALDLGALTARPPLVEPAELAEAPETPPTFRLNGIDKDGRAPLALTDHGVVGVGGRLEGHTVVTIGEDAVVVRSPRGRLVRVPLYQEEGGP